MSTTLEVLYKWQALIGAIIGGLMGFIGAQWVAYSLKRRDERAAAQIIITDLISVVEKTTTLDKAINAMLADGKIPDSAKLLRVFNKVSRKNAPSFSIV